MLDVVFIIIGLTLLIMGGNWLLKAAVALSLRLQIPRVVIGMTVVSFATSAPELIVSIKAALDGLPDLALGNVVGSNIANIGLVLGVTVVLGSIEVKKSFYTIDWPVMMLASLLFVGFIYFDSTLATYEGAIMVVLLILFLVYLLRNKDSSETTELEGEPSGIMATTKILALLIFGGLALWGGSELLVEGAKNLASSLGVSDRVIGITVVSVGTSIPELAASIIAMIKKEKAISVGNLIGSNIFNLLAVLGITAIITPIAVQDEGLLSSDIFWMLGISFIILPLVLLPKKMKLQWHDGLVLLALYTFFVYTTIT